MVSAGTVAGEATLVACNLLVMLNDNIRIELTNGSVASTAGITGAVSETGSASLAGTAGAASSAFFSLGANWLLRVPKMLLRLVGAGFVSTGLVSSTGAAGVASATTGATGSTGAVSGTWESFV